MLRCAWTALNQISSIISASLELNQVLSNAIDSVVDVMQVDVAWIFLLDEEAGELILTAPGVYQKNLSIARIESGEGKASMAGWPRQGKRYL